MKDSLVRGNEHQDLVENAPDLPDVPIDLVEDAPLVPPALVSVYDLQLPGETILQTVRRRRDEAERARLTAEHGSRRWNQARLAIEQSLADAGK